jgi:hypothetical protein
MTSNIPQNEFIIGSLFTGDFADAATRREHHSEGSKEKRGDSRARRPGRRCYCSRHYVHAELLKACRMGPIRILFWVYLDLNGGNVRSFCTDLGIVNSATV